MSKQKVEFSCTNCSYRVLKWLGCCPECKKWNSFTEIITAPQKIEHTGSTTKLVKLQNIDTKNTRRMLSGMHEWDRVVGGGITPSSLTILTGDPGIGKSTLLLQIANRLAKNYQVIYFSTEESLPQVKQRADRLSCFDE